MWVKNLYHQNKFFFLFFLKIIIFFNVFAIDWNSDIVSNANEEKTEKKTILNVYFNQTINNTDLFPSQDEMRKRVGKFINVPLIEYFFFFQSIFY